MLPSLLMISETVSFGITDIRSVEVTCAKCGATLAISLRAEVNDIREGKRPRLHESSLMCACGKPLWMLDRGFDHSIPQFIGALVLAYDESETARSSPKPPGPLEAAANGDGALDD